MPLFAGGALIVALLFPACALMPAERGLAARGRLSLLWYRAACRLLGLRVRVLGQPLGWGVLAANHISWLDIIALGSRQPLNFVAKSEVADWPVLGYLARQSGTLFIRRGDAAANRPMAQAMAERLGQGETVVLFPEGTTTRGDRVLRFHARLFQPAMAASAPVQPVAIEYRGAAAPHIPFVDDDDFLPHLLRLLLEPEIQVVLHYGSVLDSGLARDELAKSAQRHVQQVLGLAHAASEAFPAPLRS